jgi:histidinol phosphatase-like enzyme
VDALFRAVQAGWTIYLIGNEDAVARGHAPESAWKAFEERLLLQLGAAGVVVERNYACLVDPEHGVGDRCQDSVFLLPNTGAMYHARQHDGTHLGESWVIGDSSIELAAGWRAGCRTAGVRTGQALSDGVLEVDLDLLAADLTCVVDLLRVHQRAA